MTASTTAPASGTTPPAGRRPVGSPPAGSPPAGSSPAGSAQRDELLLTATAAVFGGVLLTLLPLRSTFTDWSWLTTAVLCALPYLVVVMLARSGSRSLHAWPSAAGIVASLLVTAWVFVPQHLYLGVLPTPSSWPDIQALQTQAHQTMQAEHAPVASTAGLRLLVAGAAIVLVALADVLCVLLRRPLLAAAPLLEILVVASATSSHAAGVAYFALAALGFLMIVAAGTQLQDRNWGPSVDGSGGRLGGARRLGLAAVVAALAVPLVLPGSSVNLIARATHHNGDGSGSSKSQEITLSTVADLSGSLNRGQAVPLFTVTVRGSATPFYIRQSVLDTFQTSGWVQSTGQDIGRGVIAQTFDQAPGSLIGVPDQSRVDQITASFKIINLGGSTVPVLASPRELDGVGGTWSELTGTVGDFGLTGDTSYTELAAQPNPSEAELQQAPPFATTGVDATVVQRYLELPTLPGAVSDLAARLTAGASTAYDKAKAISQYFTDPANGFVYSLSTAPTDSSNALVSFLTKKQGFCQQYAAAAAVLMRRAGLPARVVLGYTHAAPDANGQFTVTTNDAHAWVEVYFTGIGWIPFDPTPLTGADAGRAVTLPWAAHTAASATPSSANQGRPTVRPTPGAAKPTAAASAAASATSSRGPSIPWERILSLLAAVLVIGLLLASPALLRTRARRRRLALARRGDPEPLWQELAAAASDRGVLWPDTTTVAQVPTWLGGHGMPRRELESLAVLSQVVERDRYGAHQARVDEGLVSEIESALRGWPRPGPRSRRVLARWLPASLRRRPESR